MYDPAYADRNQTVAGPKDAPRDTSMQIEGNTIKFIRKDPYGYIYLSLETGELPEKYTGAYTSMDLAEYDAKRYQQERKDAIQEVKQELIAKKTLK